MKQSSLPNKGALIQSMEDLKRTKRLAPASKKELLLPDLGAETFSAFGLDLKHGLSWALLVS